MHSIHGELYASTLKCLDPATWLSGEVIDLLNETYARLSKCMFEDSLLENVESRVMFMSSLWSMQLQKGRAEDVMAVTGHIDIFDKL